MRLSEVFGKSTSWLSHALAGHIPLSRTDVRRIREIIKDLEDMDADRREGRRTLPLTIGEAGARAAARLVFTLLIILLPLPAIAGWMGLAYLLVVAIGVGGPLLILVVRLAGPHDAAAYRRIQRFLKWDMLVGLLAIIVG